MVKVAAYAVVCGVLALLAAGCGRNDNPVSSAGQGRAGQPALQEGDERVVMAPPVPCLDGADDPRIAEHAIDSLLEGLRDDFSQSRAEVFPSDLLRMLRQVGSREVRKRMFIRCNDRLWEMAMPRLAALESFGKPGGPSCDRFSDDLDVIGRLAESIWKLGADPLVQYPVAVNEYELARIRYARQESARWKARGVEEVARLYDSMADRLEAVVSDPDGPARKGFALICGRVDAAGGEGWEGRANSYKAKRDFLDRIEKALGHLPRWAIEWIEKNRNECEDPRGQRRGVAAQNTGP